MSISLCISFHSKRPVVIFCFNFKSLIYGTRGGDVVPHTWGVSTRKGDRLFIHILDLQDDALYIPLKAKVKKAIQFISKTPLSFKQEKDGIFIKLPQVPDDIDYVIELVIKQ